MIVCVCVGGLPGFVCPEARPRPDPKELGAIEQFGLFDGKIFIALLAM